MRACSLAEGSDVLIDFTTPEALEAHLAAAIEHRRPLVVGTTGLSPAHMLTLEQAAKRIPLLYARNTSFGMTILNALVEKAAQLLADETPDRDVFEIHHHHKIDAPSGTACQLAEAALKGAGEPLAPIPWYEPFSMPGKRPESVIGIAALRSGQRPGEHTMHFSWGAETLSLTHITTDRRVFAQGALKAANWLLTQKPGLYTMAHVLGLEG
jgi:4-hydroxy-tetrahydrodipicolinate reductase